MSEVKFIYSGGVEPRPYGIVGVGLCSTRIHSYSVTTFLIKLILVM